MRLFDSLLQHLRSLLRKDSANHELSDELRFHVDALVERNIADGMSPKQARIAAKSEFGSLTEATQSSYEARGTAFLDDLAQDLRYGLRSLRRQPAFSLVTILTLALGIGACTAIFSLVNAVMLRSLPYGDASRLVYLYTPNPNLKDLPPEAIGPSNADFFDLQSQAHSFSSMTMFDQKVVSLITNGHAQRIGAARIDASFLHTLETEPILGRDFTDADLEPGNDRNILISYGLWQSIFAGAADVLQRTVQLDEATYRIVGVMPPEFGYPHHTDLVTGNGQIQTTQIWVPYALTAQQRSDRDMTSINALARLRPGVSVRGAQAEMSTIVARLVPIHKGLLFSAMTALVEPFSQQILGSVSPLMKLLTAAVFFVLLIACGNAANLLLARAAERRHELGVRATLGARRGRLLRQMLTESLLIGTAAGALGIALAALFLRGLLWLNPGNLPHMEGAALDLDALAFAVGISLFTSIAFGILPALSASRINVAAFLSSTGTRGLVTDRRRLRGTLVTTQIALVVVLLTGAGLLLRSYLKVLSVPTGFSPTTVTVSINPGSSYKTRAERQAFFGTLLTRLSAQHGIDAVGLVNFIPLSDSESFRTFWVDGYPNKKHQLVEERAITSGYLNAMQTPLIAGRNFTPEEDSTNPHHVILVNQAFARIYFSGGGAIGRHIRTSTEEPWSTVIGVVQDIRNMNLETAAVPQIYDPLGIGNEPLHGVYMAVRSGMPKDTIVAVIRASVTAIDPLVAVSDIHTMSDLTEHASAPRRFQTTLLTVFSTMALMLAAVGVYGLLAYSVRQRTGEIGLRMALGSSRAGVARLILREGFTLVTAGLCIGVAAAIALSRLLHSFLYEVPALDPITFVAVPALLLVAALAACLIPTVRAAAIDPMVALRHE